MTGNQHFTFDDVGIVSLAAVDAPEVVTSESIDTRLEPFYERTGAPKGLLESLAGISQRRMWPLSLIHI